ncbi:MAG TPA: glutathione S-transferase family protein [Alphaproteobacteria bacterium]|jgi:glutathione S-transferase|nr:glutathione S-transferase family protein [Alphaproteobacteria bacterium]
MISPAKMKLRTSGTTPYGRKVMLVVHELKLTDKIEIMAPVRDNWIQGISPENPLGKVPTLITADGLVLYDSIVICEYLNDLAKGKLFPASGTAKYKALRLHALADGILEAAITQRVETHMRPTHLQWPDFLSRQRNSVDNSLKVAEQLVKEFNKEPTIGELSIAAALGYLDFRFPQDNWHKSYSQLDIWYEEISKRPSMKATMPKE